jgi:hypothetical protein
MTGRIDTTTFDASPLDTESRLAFSRRLQALTNKIHATSNLDEIMLDLSKDICDLFEADRLTIYAASKGKDFIYSKVKTGINTRKDLVLPVDDQSIAGHCALYKRSVRVDDVYDEAELKSHEPELHFRRKVDKLTGYHTKQVLTAPILAAGSKELLGVIQLINHRSGDPFPAIAEQDLCELAETLAIAFAHRMKPPSAVDSKYQPLVVDSVISGPELELAGRWARRKNLDIEGVLVDEFQVKLASVGQALAKTFGVPYERYDPDRERPIDLLAKMTREIAEQGRWLPIEEDRAGIVILTTRPHDENNARVIRKLFPYGGLFYRVTTQREFKLTLDQFFAVAAKV